LIVVDASALLEVLLGHGAGARILERLFGTGGTLHAPHLIDLEVAQVLRRFSLAGDLDATRGIEALEDLADLHLVRYPNDVLLPRIWELRQAMTAYNAAYVVLAELLGVPLLTCDRRLAAAKGHSAAVEVV